MIDYKRIADKTLLAGLLCAAFVALFTAWMVSSTVSDFRQAARLKARGYEVMSAISRLEVNLTNAEKTERGLIVGGEIEPGPFQQAMEEVRWTAALIAALTSHDPFQRSHAQRLEEMVSARLQTLEFLVEVHDAGSARTAQLLLSNEQDQIETERIKHVLGAIQERESTLLGQALHAQDAASRKLWWLLAALVACLFGGVGWHCLKVRRILREAARTQAEMRHQAEHDALTGLPNRRLLLERLEGHLARAARQRKALAVLFLDLDGFKQVNDTIGHQAGDELLKKVGQRLVAGVRAGDTVARLGGDEFVIVLPEINGSGSAARIAQALVRTVSKPYSICGRTAHVSASIGIGFYPEHGTSAASLLAKADEALNQAKTEGKNQFRFAF